MIQKRRHNDRLRGDDKYNNDDAVVAAVGAGEEEEEYGFCIYFNINRFRYRELE